MIKLYTQEEFDSSPSRGRLKIKCERCGDVFEATKKDIQCAIKGASHSSVRFCSKRCFNLHQTKKVMIKCEVCGKGREKKLIDFKRTKHQFCSRSCAATYRNSHRTSGYTRSKLEKWLESQLVLVYPNLAFSFNKRDIVNAELDIYIPLLKLAFELNGIFHYEPIYGKEKLEKIVSNDGRKFQACLEKGIELCIIDSSKENRFDVLKSKKYLDIITNLIDKKLAEQVGAAPTAPS